MSRPLLCASERVEPKRSQSSGNCTAPLLAHPPQRLSLDCAGDATQGLAGSLESSYRDFELAESARRGGETPDPNPPPSQ